LEALAGRLIVIDPGHNGRNWAHRDEINRLVDIGNGTKACNTTGTEGDGYPEALFAWEVAQLTVPLLEEAGATVLLTRTDNEGWGPCIDRRAAVGNEAGADAVISIHADGGPAAGRGFHVIHPSNIPGLTDDIYDDSYRLAVALHTAYQNTGMPIADYIARDGFSERGDLGGLNLSDIPAVFLEAGNMRNPEDLALLRNPAFQESVAAAILAALVDFFSG
jgi:N-acetylmuramoyl-L-alanine amidase